jgi:hypothetical protein
MRGGGGGGCKKCPSKTLTFQAASINLDIVSPNATNLINPALLEPKQFAIDIGGVAGGDDDSSSEEVDSSIEDEDESSSEEDEARELLKTLVARNIKPISFDIPANLTGRSSSLTS